MSSTDILHNSYALSSLKRTQLIKLCKRYGIKATGKNTELVEKLQEYARNRPADAPLTIMTSDMEYNSLDETTDDGEDTMGPGKTKVRPSEIWEVIHEETNEEMDAMDGSQQGSFNSKKGSVNSHGSMRSNRTVGEFGLTKSSGVTSSLKSLANTFKWGSKSSATSAFPEKAVETVQEPQHSTASATEPEAFQPEPTHAEREDVTMADVSVELSTTVRLISSKDIEAYPSPPRLRPFVPSFALAPASPTHRVPVYPPPRNPTFSDLLSQSNQASKLGQTTATPHTPSKADEPFVFGSPHPRHSVSNVQFNAAANSVLEEMNKRLGLAGAVPVSPSILKGRELGKAQAIIDAAALAKEKEKAARPMKTHSRFSGAHEKQFNKMEGIQDYAARRGILLGRPGPSTESAETTGQKRKSIAIESPRHPALSPSKLPGGMPGGFGDDDDAQEEEQLDQRAPKRMRTSAVPPSPPPPAKVPAQTTKVQLAPEAQPSQYSDREREAIRRKLELERARRRSSRGRPSAGGRRSSIVPAKKGATSRFGFFKGAVGAVKNVWNRGAGTKTPAPPSNIPVNRTATAPTKQEKPPVPPRMAPAAIAAKAASSKQQSSSSALKPKDASSVASKSSIPTASINSTKSAAPVPRGSVSRPGSVASTGTRLSVKGGPPANSLGLRRPSNLVANNENRVPSLNTTASVDGSRRKRERTSTLLAPTASSLARMQSTVRPLNISKDKPSISRRPSNLVDTDSRVGLKPAVAGDITNIERHVVSSRKVSSNKPEPDQASSSPQPADAEATLIAPKPHLPVRRPRISRSQIIAKLHSHRAASASSQTSSARSRKSFGGVKAAAGISRHSGAGGAAGLEARRRLRASEVARRRSRAAPGSAVGIHDCMDD
ncbi:hypothetical protein SISNIDRAFT_450767 [Sistotremastrum niveocremeum HHB9708]|uniref:SAP domain-containing protein n=1 Tax=Sistotremastrum niveocremeum HHB9708 TaxID=1314777 RepID=A0A164YJI7_9AGAM|nr:hypothetical protein SISNIDRAFT_450767 [Sistotremastrum niveocremeum HHB9708]